VLVHPSPPHTGTVVTYLLEQGLLVAKLNPRNVRFGLGDPDLS